MWNWVRDKHKPRWSPEQTVWQQQAMSCHVPIGCVSKNGPMGTAQNRG